MLHWSSSNIKHSMRKLKKMAVREVCLGMVVSVLVKKKREKSPIENQHTEKKITRY